MRFSVFLAFLSLATPAHAAGPGSPLPSCLTPFLRVDKQGKTLFAFKPRVHPPGTMPTAMEDGHPGDLVCSPGGRIIDAGAIGDEDAHGANDITIIDGRMSAFVFSSLATSFDLSPDRRFIVFRPWGGPEGRGSVVAAQTLSLVDVDQSLEPDGKALLSAVNVYPTNRDGLPGASNGKNAAAAFVKWYDWFETLPHPDAAITWIGPRQFTFILSDDGQDDVRAPWSGKAFQVMATIFVPAGKAPRVVLSIPKSPACPGGVAAIHAVVDAMAACLK